MKRTVCVILAVLLMCPVFASAEDFSSRSTEELYTIIDQARAELVKRELIEAEKAVIIDYDGISIILTGEVDLKEIYDGTKNLVINVRVINTSDKEMAVTIDELYVNGWEASGHGTFKLFPGKKAKDTIEIYHVDVDAEITEIELLKTIEFHCHTYDPDSYHSLSGDIVTTVEF